MPLRGCMSIFQRFFYAPLQSFFLFGPRGTGKSTWMKQVYKDALWIDLLQPEVLRTYMSRPEYLRELIHGNPNKPVIVIDEIQKVPTLLSIVHGIIEEKRGLQFILSGSSARKLKRTTADLLGGRALKQILNPFMAAELGENFSLTNALEKGMLPLIYGSAEPKQSLHAYISLYLQEEIQAEGLVRNLESFSRFLEAISFSHSSLLNVNNIARECEVKRKTVENYVDILEELLLAFKLPVFTKRAQRELSSHPKFYLFDAGVFQTLRPKGPLDRPEEAQGAALEGLVAQHLKAWVDYSKDEHQLAFWRTRSGLEVDLIVYGAKNFWAIEVKNATRIHSQDVRALEEFLKDYPMAKAILLYRGTERIKIKNTLCLPCEDFLLHLRPDEGLPYFDGSS